MSKILVIIISLIAVTRAVLKECKEKIDISDGQYLPNGDIEFDGVIYENGDYFYNKSAKTAFACPKLVVRKCCPFGYGRDGSYCVNVTDDFDMAVWDDYRVIKGAKGREMFRFKMQKMNCTPPYVSVMVSMLGETDWSDNWHLKSDGKLFVELPTSIPPWTVLSPDKYCIDTFLYEDEDGNTKSRLDALACFEDENPEDNFIVRSSCMLISCVFIIATVAVYAWLPELRNMHGRVLMAYLLCLFCGFICMASLQIMLTVDNITPNTCLVLTIIIYYFLESAFFWLNVMSFDIWWTFSGKGGMGMSKVSKRFCIYSLYAFGVPTILTIILTSLEFSGLQPHPLLPLLRYQGCFIHGRSKLLYLYGPMFILFVANIVFFVMTAMKIADIKQQTAVLNSKESAMHDHHRKDKQRLLLYVKLFTVMGINWILEVISALYPGADFFWMFTDAYNLLIGVTIFIIFVCKRKIFQLIKKRTKGKHSRSDVIGQEFSYRTTIPIRMYKNNQTQKSSMETIKTVFDDDNATDEIKNTKL
ncbi:PREDICTED: G-protein coupled receptor Mth-like isoform X2 [Papilio xuthus]|uniref:G-protein coupled receptor Mth-like isoform X2 n=1 Tax=Papilio xuthus TaxID=66420 RepID=A0AAJ6ZDF7_PAPXU|nr:PREDICTED: G-protein coupled receptor Mth-like isoform X2 [Papilio xuthus]